MDKKKKYKSRIMNGSLVRLILAISLPMILLMSCFPIRMKVYHPEAETGKVVKSFGREILLNEINNVTVGFEAYLYGEDQLQLQFIITFEIPENHNVQWTDRFIEIKDSTGAISKLELSWGRQRAGGISLEAPMKGYTGPITFTTYGKTKHAYYALNAYMGEIKMKKFSMKPPIFYVDDIKVDLPIITFTKKHKMMILSLNA